MEYPRPSQTPATLEHWLEMAPWPMHFISPQGEPTAANPAMGQMLGFDANQWTLRHLRQAIPQRTRNHLAKTLKDLPQDAPPPFVETALTYRHRDGSEVHTDRARISLQAPLHEPQLVMVAGARMAQSLDRADLQGRLCRLVTHELNNGFTIAQSFVDLTRRQRPDFDQAEDYLARAARALGRSIEVTELLGLITVDRPLPFEPCSLGEQVARLRPYIPRLFSPGKKWTIACEQELPRLSSHPIYLRRLVLDLCINARLFWPHSSTLDLSVCQARERTEQILIRVTPSPPSAKAQPLPFRLYFTRPRRLAQRLDDPLHIGGIIDAHRVLIDADDQGLTAILPSG